MVHEIIRSSSSGRDSYRTAAMELLFERSIQERRERMLTRADDTLLPDPTSPSEETDEESIISPAPQPPRVLPSDASVPTRPRSVLINHETPRDPSRKTKVARFEDPPVNAGTNSPSSKDNVQLFCRNCGTSQSRNLLLSGVFCGTCCSNVQCTYCWTFRISDTETCTSCYRDFC